MEVLTWVTVSLRIDIGSTTVKLVILDTNGQILFGQYRRHRAHTQETLAQLLREARQQLGPCSLRVGITGSGSMNLGKAMDIGFVQEVVAVASSLERVAPQTDVAIELGGEDAKIIYFRGGLEQRMNGVCAGGTGSFIDQMASLLQTDATGLNREAASYREIYPHLPPGAASLPSRIFSPSSMKGPPCRTWPPPSSRPW